MLEPLILTVGSLGIELYLDPARLIFSLLAGVALGLVGIWAVWRVGRLWNRSYRPGWFVGLVALVGAAGICTSAVTWTAVRYSEALATTVLVGGPQGLDSLTSGAHRACLVIRAGLPFLNKQIGASLSLECESPESLQQFRRKLGEGTSRIHQWLAQRFRRIQMATIAGVSALQFCCLAFPSWRAHRALAALVRNRPASP